MGAFVFNQSEDSVLYDDKRHPSLAFMLRNMQETEEFLGKNSMLEESIAKLGEKRREIAEELSENAEKMRKNAGSKARMEHY